VVQFFFVVVLGESFVTEQPPEQFFSLTLE